LPFVAKCDRQTSRAGDVTQKVFFAILHMSFASMFIIGGTSLVF